MRFLNIVSLLALATVGGYAASDIPASFHCAVRKFAMEYVSSMPAAQGRLQLVHDALQVDMFCNETQTIQYPPYKRPSHLPPWHGFPVLFVDAKRGSDVNGDGSAAKPFKSVQKALELSRTLQAAKRSIVLKEGTYYLQETLQLDDRDSGLTIQNYFGDEVWISGGRVLETNWQPYAVKGDLNVWVTDVPQDIKEITGLRINGERGVRARFPNANPETMGIHTNPTGWINSAASWAPAASKPVAQTVLVDHLRNDTISMFQKYTIGIGGNCDIFDPPVSYWCSKYCDGGGAFVYHVPSGLTFEDNTFSGRQWKNWTGAIVQAWRQ
jgi:hypothetical protein